MTTADVVAASKPSVAALTLKDKSGKECGSGTGFFIDGGLLVTNWHVAGVGAGGTGKLPDGKTFELVSVVAFDQASDVAVLTTDLPKGTVASLAMIPKPPPEGSDVIVIGNPLGLGHVVSDGIVSATVGPKGEASLFQITAPISPGSSGSPVLDRQGRVLGVASAMLTAGQNLNIAISADRVLSLERREPVPIADWAANAVTDAEEREATACLELAEAIVKQAVADEVAIAALIPDPFDPLEGPLMLESCLSGSRAVVVERGGGLVVDGGANSLRYAAWYSPNAWLAFPRDADSIKSKRRRGMLAALSAGHRSLELRPSDARTLRFVLLVSSPFLDDEQREQLGISSETSKSLYREHERKLRNMNPDSERSLWEQARIDLADGNSASAEKRLELLAMRNEQWQNCAEFLELRSRAFADLGRHDEALKDQLLATKLAGMARDRSQQSSTAWNEWQELRMSAMVTTIDRLVAANRLHDAVALAEAFGRDHPDSLERRSMDAKVLVAQGDREGAWKHFVYLRSQLRQARSDDALRSIKAVKLAREVVFALLGSRDDSAQSEARDILWNESDEVIRERLKIVNKPAEPVAPDK
jgi:hypothetical protein